MDGSTSTNKGNSCTKPSTTVPFPHKESVPAQPRHGTAADEDTNEYIAQKFNPTGGDIQPTTNVTNPSIRHSRTAKLFTLAGLKRTADTSLDDFSLHSRRKSELQIFEDWKGPLKAFLFSDE